MRVKFSRIANLTFFVALNFAIASCGGGGGSSKSITESTATISSPTITSFVSNTTSITTGDSVNLSWESENTESCEAGGVWSGTKQTMGTETFMPAQSSTYSLICFNSDGTPSNPESVTITVANSPQPIPTLLFSTQDSNIGFGASTNLVWSATDATSCTASGAWSGQKSANLQNMENTGPLQQTQTYNLMCSGPGGTTPLMSVTVQVALPPPPVPTLTFSTAPTTINSGESSTLSWSTTDAASCTASGAWSGQKSANLQNTENTGPLQQTQTYNLMCSGPGGTTPLMSVTVQVIQPPAPTLTFRADPEQININESTTLKWAVLNADACTASNDWSGLKQASANEISEVVGPLTQNSTFTLSCNGTGGTVVKTVNMQVLQAALGTAEVSWMPPTTREDGSALTNLAKFKIYYGTDINNMSDFVEINSPGITSHTIENLAPGLYYFTVTAIDANDSESIRPSPATKTIN